MDLIKFAQESTLTILTNAGSWIFGSSEGIISQLQNLRDSIYNTISSQIEAALDNLKRQQSGARIPLSNFSLLSGNLTLGELMVCLSNSSSGSQLLFDNITSISSFCLADDFQSAQLIFRNLLGNLSDNFTIYNLSDDIAKCNYLQTGFFDAIGFIRKTNCLTAIPRRALRDATIFFHNIGKAVVEIADLTLQMQVGLSECIQNVSWTISNFTENMAVQFNNCTNATNNDYYYDYYNY